MNLKYKFDEKKTNSPQTTGDPVPESSPDIERYDSPANVRTLCLIETSGKQTFLNYSYLITGEYLPEENTITLTFTTHTVTLKGNNLETLFGDFMNHAVKTIACVDERYVSTKNEGDTFVSFISIEENAK